MKDANKRDTSGVITALVWGQFKSDTWWSKQGGYAYTALSRPVFALAVSVILWLCVTGRAPRINRLLSLRVFDLPAKLTYSAYLVHPIIIRMYYFQGIGLTHYSPLNHVTTFIAMATYAYLCAALVALLVELPSANLMKMLVPRQPKQKPIEPEVN